MTTTPQHSPKKVRRVFFYLLLLFMVPLLLASWMAFNHTPLSTHMTNHGQLLQPPLDITQLSLAGGEPIKKGYWLLLYVNPTMCDQRCEKALYDIRQICTATGKDRDRVQRGILTFVDAPTDLPLQKMLSTEFKGTHHFVTAKKSFQQFVKNNLSEKEVLETGGIYIVDPLGNTMMFYKLSAEPMGIFKDLTQLLKLSHIG